MYHVEHIDEIRALLTNNFSLILNTHGGLMKFVKLVIMFTEILKSDFRDTDGFRIFLVLYTREEYHYAP